GRQVGQTVDPTLRISIVDDNILALNPPELAQSLPERVEVGRPVGRGRHPKETYPRHLSRLLRVGSERCGEQTQSECDDAPDGAAPHSHLLATASCRPSSFEAERRASGAADSRSEARAEAIGGRLQANVRGFGSCAATH